MVGSFTKLNDQAGAITASATATPATYTSIFEGELESFHKTSKNGNRIKNILVQYILDTNIPHDIHGDNLAVVEFVEGRGIAKGVRHMQLRLWYLREQHMLSNIRFAHVPGLKNPSDKLTKLADGPAHNEYAQHILGHALLGNVTSILNETQFGVT
jgi:hypothetical protein